MRRPSIAVLGLLAAGGIAFIPTNAFASGPASSVELRGTPLVQAATGAPATIRIPLAAAVPADSDFSFCNSTGPNGADIACFYAHLHFSNRYQFTLSNIQLKDRSCDSRSAMALVHDQQNIYESGIYGGRYYTYKNSRGCGTTQDYSTTYFEGTSPGVQYVQIALFACNSLSCSSTVESLRHGNPHW